MRIATATAFAILIALPAGARAGEQLAQPYRLTLGEVMALSASQYLTVAQLGVPSDATLLASYDKEAKKLMVWVFCLRSGAAEAQEALSNVWYLHIVPMRAYLQGMYGVQLEETDLSAVYVNRENNKEILRGENGEYVNPGVDQR